MFLNKNVNQYYMINFAIEARIFNAAGKFFMEEEFENFGGGGIV